MEFGHVTNRYLHVYPDRYIDMIPYFLKKKNPDWNERFLTCKVFVNLEYIRAL
jgi:hypothetical protein